MTEDLDELRRRAAAYDGLKAERDADTARAVDRARQDATAQARAEVRAETAPRLVDPAIRQAAAGKLTDEVLASVLASLDRTLFFDPAGDVDQAKVKAFVDGLTGASPRRFPNLGQGRRVDDNGDRGGSIAQGREMYRQRHPARARQ